jgi:ribose transport system ATP-binding protein
VPPLLKVEELSKSFAGVRALSGVHVEVFAGEVHALVGENGAGKSTLIKILMGVYTKDSGTMFIDGVEQDVRSPTRAKELGLAAVYQDVMLARELSIGENFFMGSLPRRSGLIDWRQVYKKTDEFLAGMGISVDSRSLISELTIARQQLVAIAKVVWQGARIIIFDEPTALLTTSETDLLFGIIGRLKTDGKAIIYISHHMEEIFAICDRVTVLKDGVYVDTLETEKTDKDQLITLMVGRHVGEAFPARQYHSGEPVLEVNSLSAADRFQAISFTLHRGEVLGIYGLVGAGRTELVRALFGADAYDSGEIILAGALIRPHHPMEMIKRGFGLLCEDRKHQSLALPLDVQTNINLVRHRKNTKLGFIRRRAEHELAETYIHSLNIKPSSPYQTVLNLSGGNQQKVVIGKWLSVKPQILFFDEPTTGVDVGARIDIYHLMQELVDDGKAIIVISSYLPEVIALSDRIMVMYHGRSMGIVDRKNANEEMLLRMASGLEPIADSGLMS